MQAPAPLRARTVAVSEVPTVTRDGMWALFESVYDDVDRARFQDDLDDKDHVILLEDTAGSVRGFSTLKRMRVEVDGRTHHGVYSGDTVVSPQHWGGRALGQAFLAYMLRSRLRHPWSPLWWFLISKGYKTYLLMANNFPQHWPRHEAHTPPQVQRVMDAFASARFGETYDPRAGLVRVQGPSGRLQAGVAGIDAELAASHPRIAYFVHRNPHWQRGDELVCLAPMNWTMPLAYAWKKRGLGGTR